MSDAQDQAGPPDSTRMEPVQYPWEPDGSITANLAIGNLRDSMLMWLTSDRGVHVETLMTAIGAVAGFAAQNAAFVAARSSAKPLPQNALVEATAGTEKYYFGDFINAHLLQQLNGAKYPLWSIVAAAALEAGVQESDLPDLTEIFRHVAGSVGKPTFGVLRTPEGHPTHLSPRQALDLFWPRVKFILSRTDGPGSAKGESVAPEHWPLVIALVARQYLLMGKDTLDPRISLKLMMESAIAMSKVDPKTVPQTEPDAPGDARQ